MERMVASVSLAVVTSALAWVRLEAMARFPLVWIPRARGPLAWIPLVVMVLKQSQVTLAALDLTPSLVAVLACETLGAP